MLGVSKYPPAYVKACRGKVDKQLSTYRKLVSTAKNGDDGAALTKAADAFEAELFRNLVVALDAYFVHRLRNQEGKDGNPLNEVRMLCNSILEHDGVLTEEKSIKYKADDAVLHIEVGGTIRIDDKEFKKLAAAYFDEIEKRYS